MTTNNTADASATESDAPKKDRTKASVLFLNRVASIEATEETDDVLVAASADITAGQSDEASAARRIGFGLRRSKDRHEEIYGKQGRGYFEAWSKARHGIEKSQVYVYLRAEKFWSEVAEMDAASLAADPSAVGVGESLSISTKTAAFLADIEEDHRVKILDEVGHAPTLAEVTDAADLVVPSRKKAKRDKVKNEAKAESDAAAAIEASNQARIVAEVADFAPKYAALLTAATAKAESDGIAAGLSYVAAGLVQWAGNFGPMAAVVLAEVRKAQ